MFDLLNALNHGYMLTGLATVPQQMNANAIEKARKSGRKARFKAKRHHRSRR
jgi:hypothetical protein